MYFFVYFIYCAESDGGFNFGLILFESLGSQQQILLKGMDSHPGKILGQKVTVCVESLRSMCHMAMITTYYSFSFTFTFRALSRRFHPKRLAYTHSHTIGGVNHASRQPARQEQSG